MVEQHACPFAGVASKVNLVQRVFHATPGTRAYPAGYPLMFVRFISRLGVAMRGFIPRVRRAGNHPLEPLCNRAYARFVLLPYDRPETKGRMYAACVIHEPSAYPT